MPKRKSILSVVFVSILLLAVAVSIVPRVLSTTGTGVMMLVITPGGPPVRNDAIPPTPRGYLINSVPPAPPAGLVPGPASARAPWSAIRVAALPGLPPPGAGVPAGWALVDWTSQGGPVQPGILSRIDILVPAFVWDAAGGGYMLTRVSWSAGISLGVPSGLNCVFLDVDSDGTVQLYDRFYAVDPGEITFTYEPVVGGIVVPTDKFGLLAPYIGLASTIMFATAASVVYARRVKRRKET